MAKKASKSKRVKSDKPALIRIDNWEQAATILHWLGNGQASIARQEELATGSIAAIKLSTQTLIDPMQVRCQQMVRSLEVFAQHHKKEFGQARSKTLASGVLGWQASTSISVKKTTLEKIKEFFRGAKRKSCITVKESVDKNALAKLTDEELASVGARRVRKDAFYAEPLSHEAADYHPESKS